MLPVVWLASARDNLREIVAHPNYIVLYRVAAERIEIVNVVHARQQYPNQAPQE